MKVLKVLLITMISLSISTGYAAPLADEEMHDLNQFVEAIQFGDEIIAYNLGFLLRDNANSEESKGRITILVDEYCTTRDLEDYKKKLEGLLSPKRLKYIKRTSVGIGSVGVAAIVSTFFFKRLSGFPQIGIAAVSIVTGLLGAALSKGVNEVEENFYEFSDLELKKSLNTFCDLAEK